MGLTNAISYLYLLKKITFLQLLEIARNRCNINNNTYEKRKPSIDVDCSWIVRKRMCIDVASSVSFVLSIATSLSKEGIDVLLVCDGSIRHHSKRATVQRRSQVQRKKLDLIVCKAEIIQLSHERQSTDSMLKKQEIENEQQQMQAKIKSLEKSIQNASVDVGDSFFYTLVEEIEQLTEKDIGNNGGSVAACQAKFQADSVMSARMKHKQTDLLLTCDSDQAALLGSDCICIKDFKFHAKEKRMCEIDMFFASKKVLEEVVDCIGLPADCDKIFAAKYPLFEKIVCPRIRSLIAVSVGCDVNLFAITTPQQIHQYVSSDTEFVHAINEQNSVDAYFALKKYIMLQYKLKIQKKPSPLNKRVIKSVFEVEENKFSQMIEVFVDAFLFEPSKISKRTNVATVVSTYIHYAPGSKLHPYITAFDIEPYEQEEVDCCTDLLCCPGTGTGRHLIMKAEGYCVCTTCKVQICKECVCQKKNGEKHYCFDCYLPEVSVTNSSITDNNNYPTIYEIRTVLRTHGIETNDKDNIVDVLDLYEAVVKNENSKNKVTGEILLSQHINVPTHEADYLQVLQTNTISSFDFKNGGQFVVDNRLNKEDMFHILKIMAKLVHISNHKQKDAYKNSTYQLLPSMLISFAEGARVHSGYRLIKRCIRHAVDPQTNSILEASGFIVRHCNHPAIVVHHRMKASMKNATYDVRVAFTGEQLICCTCTCKAGCAGGGRVLCVHILPVLYQITMLMFDGLAESILIETAHHWTRRTQNNRNTTGNDEENNNNEDNISNEEVKKYLLLIRSACDINSDEDNNKTVAEILEKYKVGTEKGKKLTLPPRDPELLGPLRYQSLESSRNKAKRLINVKVTAPVTQVVTANGVQGNNDDNGEVQQLDIPPVRPSSVMKATTYQNIVKCVHVIINSCRSSDPTCMNDMIGYKILEQRASPCTLKNPGNTTTIQRSIKRLLKIANETECKQKKINC